MLLKFMLLTLSFVPLLASAHSSICSASYQGEFSRIPIFDINARPNLSELDEYTLVVTAEEGISPFFRLSSSPQTTNLVLRNGESLAADEIKVMYVSPDNDYHELTVAGRVDIQADHEGNYHGKFFFQLQRPLIMYNNGQVEVDVRIETVCQH